MSEETKRASGETARNFLPTRRSRVLALSVSAVGVIIFTVLLRDVFTPVAIALSLAYIFEPVLTWMERRRVRRGIAIALLYFVLAVVMISAVMSMGPLVARQTVKLYRFASETVRKHGAELLQGSGQRKSEDPDVILKEYVGLLEKEAEKHGGGIATNTSTADAETVGDKPADSTGDSVEKSELRELVDDRVESLNRLIRENAGAMASRAGTIVYSAATRIVSGVTSLLSFFINFILVLVYTVFFMLGFPAFKTTVKKYLPADYRESILDILGRIDRSVANFFRGRLLICLIAGAAASIGLRISGVDYWLLLGMASGILSLVPFLGVLVMFVLSCVFAALAVHPVMSLIGVCVTFGVVQWIIEPVIGTIVLSKGVKMHPVAILLSLFIGGRLLGVLGVLLSIPLASVVWILFKQLLLPGLKELAGHEEDVAPAHAGGGDQSGG